MNLDLQIKNRKVDSKHKINENSILEKALQYNTKYEIRW